MYRRADFAYAWYIVNGYSLRYLTVERLENSDLADDSVVDCNRVLSLYSSTGMSNDASRKYSSGIGYSICLILKRQAKDYALTREIIT